MREKLVMSRYLRIIPINKDNFLVYHSIFGFPQIMNYEGIEFLRQFQKNEKNKKRINFNDFKDEILKLKSFFFIILENFNEKDLLIQKQKNYLRRIESGKNIEYLSLIVSNSCNFSCSYCIASRVMNLNKKNESGVMKIEIAMKAIDFFFAKLKKNRRKKAYINFGGGEPLLNWKLIKKILEYCRKKYGESFKITFSINTNAFLITKEIAKTLKEFKVILAISLDGLGKANDLVRKNKNGEGTFNKIIKAINILRNEMYPIKGFSTTVTEKNFPFIDEELINFAHKQKLHYIRIDLDVIHALKIPLNLVVKKIFFLKQYGKERGINITGFWERPIENFNHSPIKRQVSFCGGTAGNSLCVNYCGNIYICGYSKDCIGNVNNPESIFGKETRYYKIIVDRLSGNVTRCHGCFIEGQCAGGCYITEESVKKEGGESIKYNCRFYKRMTKKLLIEKVRQII